MGPHAPFLPPMVMGLNDAAVDAGLYRWPSEKVGFEVCGKLAEELQGPSILPAEGLGKLSALSILQTLKTAADRLASQGYEPSAQDVSHQKQASSLDLETRAARVAEAYMRKAAAEGGSLTGVGENTPESAAMHDQHAKLDLHNRGPAEYLVGVGNHNMPDGGVVGKEMSHPKTQKNSPSLSNSLTEMSAKAAAEKLADLGEVLKSGLGGVKKVFKDEGLRGGVKMLGGHLGEELKAHPLRSAAAVAAPLAAGLAAKKLFSRKPEEKTAFDLALFALGKTADEDMAAGDLSGAGAGAEAGGEAPGGGDEEAALHALIAQHPELLQLLQQAMAGQGGAGEGALPAPDAPPAAPVAPAAPAPEMLPKTAASQLLAKLQKLAEGGGSLTSVGKNTAESAAKDDQHAALDQHNRSTKQYLEGQGKTVMPDKGQQFAIEPNKAHEEAVHTDTVPSRENKSAAVKLSAEDAEYIAQLRKVAEFYGPRLPVAMSQDEKIAHIRQLHARPPRDREAYVATLRG